MEPNEKKDQTERSAAETMEQQENESASPETPQKAAGFLITKTHIIIAAVTAVALLAGGIAIGYWMNRQNDPMAIDPHAQYMGTMAGAQTNPDPERIMIPGFGTLYFPKDTTNVDILLMNPAGNPCYFRYTLRLKETGEILYTSQLIPPGMGISQIKLTRPLPRGEYTLIVETETFSADESMTPMNGANAEVTLFCS